MFYTNNHCCCRQITRHVFYQNYKTACKVVIMYILAQLIFCLFHTMDSCPYLDGIHNISSPPCSTQRRLPLSSLLTILLSSSTYHCTIEQLYGPHGALIWVAFLGKEWLQVLDHDLIRIVVSVHIINHIKYS